MSGGFATPGQGFWGLALAKEDRWPADQCEPDLRRQLYAQLDSLVAQGIARDAAVRFIEDQLAWPRGAFQKFLER